MHFDAIFRRPSLLDDITLLSVAWLSKNIKLVSCEAIYFLNLKHYCLSGFPFEFVIFILGYHLYLAHYAFWVIFLNSYKVKYSQEWKPVLHLWTRYRLRMNCLWTILFVAGAFLFSTFHFMVNFTNYEFIGTSGWISLFLGL